MRDQIDGLKIVTADAFDPDDYVGILEPSTGVRVQDADAAYWKAIITGDRAYAALDDDRVVGTCLAEPLRLTVPGGDVALAGLEFGFVLPSHRRRGLLSGLIARLLDQAREYGEVLAAGWPSESIIHARFGMAPATTGSLLQLDRHYAVLREPRNHRGSVRLVDPEDVPDVLPGIYERVRASTPGMVTRAGPRWSTWPYHDPLDWQDPSWRQDVGPRTFAVWGDQGYVAYRLQRRWDLGGPQYRLLVAELIATEAAYAGLWQWCFDVDLATSLVASLRPAEDPIRLMLADHRRLRVSTYDGMWLRIVDAAGALSARTYRADGTWVIRVVDEFGPWASGTVQLQVENGVGTTAATAASADVTLPSASLAAAYLGDVRLRELAIAGRASEQTPGALISLDHALSSAQPPWSPWLF